MKKYFMFVPLLMMTLIPPSFVEAGNYVHRTSLQASDTSTSKQFSLSHNEGAHVIVCNHRESSTSINYTLSSCKGEKYTIGKAELGPGKESGFRIPPMRPGNYHLEINSPGGCRVQGRILILEEKIKPIRIDLLREEDPPSKGERCVIQ